jgi:hypothetical protein
VEGGKSDVNLPPAGDLLNSSFSGFGKQADSCSQRHFRKTARPAPGMEADRVFYRTTEPEKLKIQRSVRSFGRKEKAGGSKDKKRDVCQVGIVQIASRESSSCGKCAGLIRRRLSQLEH